MLMAFSIVSALFDRARNGKGRRLQVAAISRIATSCCPRPISDFDMRRSERLPDLLA